MKKIIFLILLSVFVSVSLNILLGQEKSGEKRLDMVFYYLDSIWTDEQKEVLKAKKESDLIEYHMTVNLWIRNKWLRGDNRDTLLIRYMVNMGFGNPDAISSAILKSYHRRLNNKEIDLEEQAQRYKK